MQKNEYSQLPLRGAKTEALCDINLWEKKLSTFSLEENNLNLYIPLRWMEMSLLQFSKATANLWHTRYVW